MKLTRPINCGQFIHNTSIPTSYEETKREEIKCIDKRQSGEFYEILKNKTINDSNLNF